MANKKAKAEALAFNVRWWSRGESNPRPQALYSELYILSLSVLI